MPGYFTVDDTSEAMEQVVTAVYTDMCRCITREEILLMFYHRCERGCDVDYAALRQGRRESTG